MGGRLSRRAACFLLAHNRQACAPRLDIEVGHSATSASVRHSVWKRRMRSFSYADRVGVALERCPGIPSFGRWRARVERIWSVARAAARFMEPQPIDTARIAHQRRLHQSSAGGDAACERFVFSRERIGRRRASEAGARASTSRDSYRSTRLVGGDVGSRQRGAGARPCGVGRLSIHAARSGGRAKGRASSLHAAWFSFIFIYFLRVFILGGY